MTPGVQATRHSLFTYPRIPTEISTSRWLFRKMTLTIEQAVWQRFVKPHRARVRYMGVFDVKELKPV